LGGVYGAKPAISTTGFEESCQAKPAISTTGPTAGRKSQCEPLAEVILAKVEVGFSAQRILPGSGGGKGLRGLL
jgi:hypothetical protein